MLAWRVAAFAHGALGFVTLAVTQRTRNQMTTRPTLAVFLFASLAAAQTPPCLAENDQNPVSNGIVSSGNNIHLTAAMITPATTQVVEGIRIYTSNDFGNAQGLYQTLELWSGDATSMAPQARLAGGSWHALPSLVPPFVFRWQGCTLDNPVLLQAGQNYWIVRTEPGWCGVPNNAGGVQLPMRSKVATAASWGPLTTGPFTAFTYRLYCSPLDDQGVVPFGSACASSGNSLAAAFTNHEPTVGNVDFSVECTGLPPGVPAINVLGVQSGYPSVPLPGTNSCFANTDVAVTLGGVVGTGTVRAATVSGHVRFAIPIPANAALQGFFFASQVVAIDPGAAGSLPIVTSNALRITVY